jgi:hypothetical protein
MNHPAQRGREARAIDAEIAGEAYPLFKLPVFRRKHNLSLENNSSGSFWRRERDSNPRYPFRYNGFQDRLFQPLTHPSA